MCLQSGDLTNCMRQTRRFRIKSLLLNVQFSVVSNARTKKIIDYNLDCKRSLTKFFFKFEKDCESDRRIRKLFFLNFEDCRVIVEKLTLLNHLRTEKDCIE